MARLHHRDCDDVDLSMELKCYYVRLFCAYNSSADSGRFFNVFMPSMRYVDKQGQAESRRVRTATTHTNDAQRSKESKQPHS